MRNKLSMIADTAKRLLLSMTVLLFASGCQTTDPAKGGFFGGVGGLASGNYQAGVDQRKAKLEDAQDQQVALQREADRAEQQNASMTADIKEAEAQIAALSRELAELDKKIDVARAGANVNQAEVDRIEAGLSDIGTELEAQQLTLDEQKKLTTVQQLRRRKQQLEKALLALFE
jgi:chromosome segregation ATPase